MRQRYFLHKYAGLRRKNLSCPDCNKVNDPEAVFCAECGTPLGTQQSKAVSKQRRVYFIALLFVPIIVIGVVIGYCKFYLPNGIVAQVNGEEIKLSELDAAAARMQHMSGETAAERRSRSLNELIAERLVLQEARKAGITVSKNEIAAAVAEACITSGLDDAAFRQAMISMYGTEVGYETYLERRLMINRLIAQKILKRSNNPQTTGPTVSQWLQNLSEKATVRVALTEQLSGPGCGYCSPRGGQPQSLDRLVGSGCAMAAGRQGASDSTKATEDAGLNYWHGKYGPSEVIVKRSALGVTAR